MIVVIIVIAVIAYAGFHLGAGHAHHRHAKRPRAAAQLLLVECPRPVHELRLPGGLRVGHGSEPGHCRGPRSAFRANAAGALPSGPGAG